MGTFMKMFKAVVIAALLLLGLLLVLSGAPKIVSAAEPRDETYRCHRANQDTSEEPVLILMHRTVNNAEIGYVEIKGRVSVGEYKSGINFERWDWGWKIENNKEIYIYSITVHQGVGWYHDFTGRQKERAAIAPLSCLKPKPQGEKQ